MMAELLLAMDFETTNLTLHPNADLSKQPRAIEFGGALVDMATGEIVEELSVLIDPEEEITAEITKITGITNDDVRGAPKFIEVLPQLRHMFAQATVVAAHNLPFDRMILKCELRRANVLDFPWPPREMCTVGVYKEHWGRNPKLTELYEFVMGEPLAQTHRALEDVKAMVEIIQKDRLWELA
jgi:DNA polymerase III epsilon subunit-like protein